MALKDSGVGRLPYFLDYGLASKYAKRKTYSRVVRAKKDSGCFRPVGWVMTPWQMGSTPGEFRFSILGIPIRVHPMFWLTALVLGIHSTDPVTLLAWVLAVFVGVLIHELGHALVMRGYGFYPEILLYGLGGVTDYGVGGGTLRLQPIQRIQISAAGPAAGFLLAAAVVLIVRLLGGETGIYWLLGFIPIPILEPVGSQALTAFLQSLVYIGVFWGLINLMPVFPLDGGQIAREILLAANPRTGIEQSLVLSFYCALFLAFVGFFALSSLFMTLLFGYLAYSNYELLRGRPRPW